MKLKRRKALVNAKNKFVPSMCMHEFVHKRVSLKMSIIVIVFIKSSIVHEFTRPKCAGVVRYLN